MTDGVFFVRSGVEDDRAGLRQRRSQFAVLISGLPATLPRIPSKMLGASRPCAEGCGCTFVEAAIALIAMSPTTNTIPACRPLVIDQSICPCRDDEIVCRCKPSAETSLVRETSYVVIVASAA
jgi:hypothetical protein